MVWLVEVSSYGGISIVGDGMPVTIHSLSKSLFCLSYILFVTFETCNKVYDFV